MFPVITSSQEFKQDPIRFQVNETVASVKIFLFQTEHMKNLGNQYHNCPNVCHTMQCLPRPDG